MLEAFAGETVRAAEAPLVAAGVPLMRRAAAAVAATVERELAARGQAIAGASIVLLVGSGNNGGDALYAGAALARRGARVVAMTGAQTWHEPAMADLLGAGGVHHSDLARHEALVGDAAPGAGVHAVVDGIVGTGTSARPELCGGAAALAARVGEMLRIAAPDGRGGGWRPVVVAVDQPSGVGTDTGAVPRPGTVIPADVTVALGVAKPGLLLPPAALLAGRIEVADIGLGTAIRSAGPVVVRRLADDDLVARGLLAVPPAEAQKYTRGVVGVVAGTAEFPGAAVLATDAAVRAGAGMVRYLGPRSVARLVVAKRPEVVPANGRVQAWAIGPGLPAWEPDSAEGPVTTDAHATTRAETAGATGQRRRAMAALAAALGEPEPRPIVVDAGGLGLLPQRCPPSVVLTPHAGELARLLSWRGTPVTRADVEAEPYRWVCAAHEMTGATVLLKGAVTLIAGPADGGGVAVWSQADGTPWLATAGAGDVLTGVLASLLAQHSEAVLARPEFAAEVAAAAAKVHGLAARLASGGGPIAAGDVVAAIGRAIAGLLEAARLM